MYKLKEMKDFFHNEKVAQDSLIETFSQIGFTIVHSELVCNIHNCTDGNVLLCTDGVFRKIRRYIDVRNKKIYWCFPK